MPLDSAVDYESITVSELSTSFNIEVPYSIPADARPYMIELSEATLDASYEYLAVPKVDLSAFLLARLTGWEKLNLIDGPANVYFGNTYIGESEINTRLMGDTLELSLGRDNNVLVSRQKIIDQSKTKFFGTKKQESFVYEIQIKNNREIPVTIKLQDQIPISQIADIIVEPLNVSGAETDIISGRLQWISTLASGDSRKYVIAFDVKYPKNMKVAITKNKVVRTPRFRQ